MSPHDESHQTLTRERLVEAALELIQGEGLNGLSMRALADTLQVKAASLYWHVRDRRELLELLAESILETVRPSRNRTDWRSATLDAALALKERLARQNGAAQILLEAPESLERSPTYAELTRHLQKAGLQPAEASRVALMVMVDMIASPSPGEPRPADVAGSPRSVAVDSGSRGVLLRAGSGMDAESLFRTGRDRNGAAPGANVRGETVVVRRLRGVGFGEIELNPRHPWRFQIQGATWNTLLDAASLEVQGIKLDSGVTKFECFLPRPHGVVLVEVSSGVVGVTLHRPPGVAVAAHISTGAVGLKLDDQSFRATVSDIRWESQAGASSAADRYDVRISSGVVQLSLDSAAKGVPPMEPPVAARAESEPLSALDILLDGVASRVRSGTLTGGVSAVASPHPPLPVAPAHVDTMQDDADLAVDFHNLLLHAPFVLVVIRKG